MSSGSEVKKSDVGLQSAESDLTNDVLRKAARIKGMELIDTFGMFLDDQDDLRERNRRRLNELMPRGAEAGDDMNIRNTFLGDVTMTSEQLTKLTSVPSPTQERQTQRMAMELRESSRPTVEPPVSAPAGQPTSTPPAASNPAWKKWVKAGLAGAALAAAGAGGWGVSKCMAPESGGYTDTSNTIRFPADDPDTYRILPPAKVEE